ncbi:single-stranded DNA-binding protein [Sphingobacterium spiritivorum]|uniref:single-stranded DNA-binding protein n=1 Tax=Sphingobacterium spiritivorum TaxID=258 RepID=UPI003DA34000
MNITGRLTRDAEVRTTSQDKKVVNFSVATNDSYKNKQGERIEQNNLFRLLVLDNSQRSQTTHKRHTGRTNRQGKYKSVDRK